MHCNACINNETADLSIHNLAADYTSVLIYVVWDVDIFYHMECWKIDFVYEYNIFEV